MPKPWKLTGLSLLLASALTLTACGPSRTVLVNADPPPKPLVPSSLRTVPDSAKIDYAKRLDEILQKWAKGPTN